MQAKKAKQVFSMTEQEYSEHCAEDNGICLACGDIRYGLTEPDAEGYPCESCDARRVCGVEQALLMGRIAIKE